VWGPDDLPEAIADYVGIVSSSTCGFDLEQYPGSPAFAQMLAAGCKTVGMFELHPTDIEFFSHISARSKVPRGYDQDGLFDG